MDALKAKIRHVPDFPKTGILFYDVTTLLRDSEGFRIAIDSLANPYKGRGISLVVGIESRGFILGAAVADRIGAGFVPVRKVGKLPSVTVRVSYDLEYGSDSLEMHRDAIEPGQRVLIVDDLLATGGTARATVDLVKQLGGKVEGVAFLIELAAKTCMPCSSTERVLSAALKSAGRFQLAPSLARATENALIRVCCARAAGSSTSVCVNCVCGFAPRLVTYSHFRSFLKQQAPT
jgi:adenine phosphoribosyltransferase